MRYYNLKAASAISDCLLRDGPIPCALAIRTNVSTPSGIISVSTGRRIRDCASIIFLLNAELAPRLRSAGVDRWVRDRPRASDHAPTWIELDMGAKRQRSTVKRSNTPSKITLG